MQCIAHPFSFHGVLSQWDNYYIHVHSFHHQLSAWINKSHLLNIDEKKTLVEGSTTAKSVWTFQILGNTYLMWAHSNLHDHQQWLWWFFFSEWAVARCEICYIQCSQPWIKNESTDTFIPQIELCATKFSCNTNMRFIRHTSIICWDNLPTVAWEAKLFSNFLFKSLKDNLHHTIE